MSTFYLKIISSDRVFYEGPCCSLIIPAIDGEQAIMAHHEEIIIAVKNGEMRMQTEEGGEWTYAVLGEGFCMAANNRVTLLADTVERPEEVDANRAREALERAKERLRQKQSIQEYHLTQAAMARALVRLKETEKFVR
ncbi:MAG: ATP synthase F1 subunit epsilon [Eubacteriales bacterium]|nr:ATP synthase F1 subunit epsilon [Eubacteriales bacterium]